MSLSHRWGVLIYGIYLICFLLVDMATTYKHIQIHHSQSRAHSFQYIVLYSRRVLAPCLLSKGFSCQKQPTRAIYVYGMQPGRGDKYGWLVCQTRQWAEDMQSFTVFNWTNMLKKFNDHENIGHNGKYREI